VLVVVVDEVCPDWSGMAGFQDRLNGCPESWVESDVIAWSPVLETWIERLGVWLSCWKFMLALKWCVFRSVVDPPVCTAMSVWEQSTLLLKDCEQTGLPLLRVVAGSSAVLRYWSLV